LDCSLVFLATNNNRKQHSNNRNKNRDICSNNNSKGRALRVIAAREATKSTGRKDNQGTTVVK